MPRCAGARPLKSPVFHILLALSEGALHGLGIAAEIEEASGGAVRLGPGTLYRSLDEMQARGLIEHVAAPGKDVDPRRKYYAITDAGRTLAEAEAKRFARLVAYAKTRRLLPEGT